MICSSRCCLGGGWSLPPSRDEICYLSSSVSQEKRWRINCNWGNDQFWMEISAKSWFL